MTITVGYTPKPEGRAAPRRALEEAQLREDRLLVVNSSRGDAYVDEHFAQEHDLVHVRHSCEAVGIDFEVRQVVRGREAADEVLGVAEEVGTDLLVIGLRRRTPVGKLILGSTAQRILLNANCPVLAVKPTAA